MESLKSKGMNHDWRSQALARLDTWKLNAESIDYINKRCGRILYPYFPENYTLKSKRVK